MLPVWNPSLPLHGAVQVVGRVELEPRLAGPDLKHSPTGWMSHSETHTHQRYQTLEGLKTWSRYQVQVCEGLDPLRHTARALDEDSPPGGSCWMVPGTPGSFQPGTF